MPEGHDEAPVAGGSTRTPSGIVIPGDIDAFHRRIHHVTPSMLGENTAQTGGMRRRVAISGDTVGARKVWMGQTHVAPATVSANHHHGDSETAIYVVSGSPVFVFVDLEDELPRERRIQGAPGDFIFVPPFVPHREENPDPRHEAIVVVSRTTQDPIVVNLDALTWS